MTTLVADCPRCGAKMITFDVRDAIKIGHQYGWQNWYEAFCLCRKCTRSTVFILSENEDADSKLVHERGLTNINVAANRYVDIEGYISTKDAVIAKPPEHVPDGVADAFREGATCFASNCYNAAGAMFRLCIDLATRSRLPEGDVEGLNKKTRRDLGLRLPWLFDNGALPEALRELSLCVKDDGNDGAHQGSLSKADAGDLLDFTRILLERIYTEPERLRIAKERRNERREKTES